MAVRRTSRGGRFQGHGRRWALAGGAAVLIGTGALAPVTAGAVVAGADLSVTISHSPDSPVSPSDMTFTVTAHNAGPDTATAAVAALGLQYPIYTRDLPDACRRASNYNSLVCDLGDIASGASASIEIPVQAQGSGLVTVPAAVASDTADPVAANGATNDIVLIRPGPPQADRYITGIFPIILDRPVDQASLTYWAAKWKAENNRYPRHLEKIPAGIMQSNEYRRLQIRALYTKVLGRSADAASLTYWTAKAASGWSYPRIERSLIASNEYLNKHHGTEIQSVFQTVLGRTATSAELSKYAHLTGGLDVLAGALQRTTEGYNLVINAGYHDILGVAPTQFGKYIWQGRLRQGATAETLRAQLLVSGDFLQHYPYTNDDYSYGEPVYDLRATANAAAAAQAG